MSKDEAISLLAVCLHEDGGTMTEEHAQTMVRALMAPTGQQDVCHMMHLQEVFRLAKQKQLAHLAMRLADKGLVVQ